jgi:hypothetical protein
MNILVEYYTCRITLETPPALRATSHFDRAQCNACHWRLDLKGSPARGAVTK